MAIVTARCVSGSVAGHIGEDMLVTWLVDVHSLVYDEQPLPDLRWPIWTLTRSPDILFSCYHLHCFVPEF